MIIVGAGGHAKELLAIVREQSPLGSVFFYDDVTKTQPDLFLNQFKVLRTGEEVMAHLLDDPRFALGIGNPKHRYQLAEKFKSWGGVLTSVISSSASIGSFNILLGEGLNIMSGAILTEEVTIGKGTLVHVHASVHHDCRIGEYCEILPGSRILGHVTIGNFTSIGSGAIVLPKISIGKNVIVGAGAVVTKNIGDGKTVKGVPAR